MKTNETITKEIAKEMLVNNFPNVKFSLSNPRYGSLVIKFKGNESQDTIEEFVFKNIESCDLDLRFKNDSEFRYIYVIKTA